MNKNCYQCNSKNANLVLDEYSDEDIYLCIECADDRFWANRGN